jgi:hypothetical protein
MWIFLGDISGKSATDVDSAGFPLTQGNAGPVAAAHFIQPILIASYSGAFIRKRRTKSRLRATGGLLHKKNLRFVSIERAVRVSQLLIG